MNIHKITYHQAEGTGGQNSRYASAERTVWARSIKNGVAQAVREVESEINRSWDEQGVRYGGCCVFAELTINNKIVND